METILLIEDNLDIRENTCELLELDGFKVLVAESGELGLRLARKKKPDVIICDIKLRGIDGYAVLEELRKDLTTSNIPVIVLSAMAEKHEVETALAMGANAYIKKPFTEQELIACISLCTDINKSNRLQGLRF